MDVFLMKKETPDKVKPYLKYLANAIILIVVIVGLFMGATILVGQEEKVDKEIPILKGYPWYAIVGIFTSVLYLSVSKKYLSLMETKNKILLIINFNYKLYLFYN